MVEARTHEMFQELLKKSRLLTAKQLADVAARGTVDAGRTPAWLARNLVDRGWLTEWQARQLLVGRYGFFLGKYKLLDRLGAGGMGVVFKAHHPMTDRTVAVKVMAKSLLSNPAAAARFQREVRLVCALNHPNIIAAYDADTAGGVHFLVMEYVEGRDLASLVKSYGPLGVAQAVNYVAQAATGLAHAHDKGVIHRDIKPANLFLDGNGLIKILDLGLARFDENVGGDDSTASMALTRDGMVAGTVDYISPEQAEEMCAADARSDIYSLGCTLCYLLTGQPVYGGGTPMKRLFAHREQPIPSLRERRGEIPPPLESVFQRMVAKRPDARFPTMHEVAAALLPFESGRHAATFQPAPRSPRPEASAAEAISSVDVAVDTYLTELANQSAIDALPPSALPPAALPPSSALPPSGLAMPPVEPTRVQPASTVPRATLLTPPVVAPPPGFAPPAYFRPSPIFSTSSAHPLMDARWRRVGYDEKKWLLWLVGVVAGVLVALPVIGALVLTRPTALLLDWRLDERQGCRLDVDGKEVAIPAGNPATISLAPGQHRIIVRRRGYDQLEWEFSVTRGSRIERRIEWSKFGLRLPREPK
ncbi:MAG TPA: protein kinase [Pirellulales bacterium]|nr:protein kinase [Pirellulales bacterium]